MSLYALDTDILSLYEHSHPGVVQAVRRLQFGEFAITVITVEEQLSGWYALLRQARTTVEMGQAYQRLATCVQLLSGLPILSFTPPALSLYD